MMPDNEKPGTPALRNAAVLLGALAVGAVLSAALGATTADASISDQFSAAFTPGTLKDTGCTPQIVVSDG